MSYRPPNINDLRPITKLVGQRWHWHTYTYKIFTITHVKKEGSEEILFLDDGKGDLRKVDLVKFRVLYRPVPPAE